MDAYALPAGAAVLPGEEEVGIQVACARCGEPWPADPEFFYLKRRGPGRTVGLDSVCRACRAEARVRAVTPEARLARFVAEQDRADRRAYQRAIDRLRWGSMTADQRETRNSRRRARRREKAA